jgi:hypothetical protein
MWVDRSVLVRRLARCTTTFATEQTTPAIAVMPPCTGKMRYTPRARCPPRSSRFHDRVRSPAARRARIPFAGRGRDAEFLSVGAIFYGPATGCRAPACPPRVLSPPRRPGADRGRGGSPSRDSQNVLSPSIFWCCDHGWRPEMLLVLIYGV